MKYKRKSWRRFYLAHDRGLQRYLRNFEGVWTPPNHPRRYATDSSYLKENTLWVTKASLFFFYGERVAVSRDGNSKYLNTLYRQTAEISNEKLEGCYYGGDNDSEDCETVCGERFSWTIRHGISEYNIVILGGFRKIAKNDYWLGHVCLYAWNNCAPTGRIFMKIDIWVIFEDLSKKIQVSLKSDDSYW